MAIMATISAVMLGKSWVILLRRFPIYRTHCRKPYAGFFHPIFAFQMITNFVAQKLATERWALKCGNFSKKESSRLPPLMYGFLNKQLA